MRLFSSRRANGCVCCEVRDELAKGLETLLELRGSFDYILIETTGARVTTRCGLKGNRLTLHRMSVESRNR